MAKPDASPKSENVPHHDPLADALGPSPLEQFLDDNKALLFGGLAAVVLGVIAAIWFNGAREAADLESAQAFSSATSLADFNALIAANPKSVVAANALMRKATLLEEDGKAEEARAALVELREGHPDHPLVDQATLALARLAADANQMDQARDFLSEIPSNSDLAALAQMQLGDLAYRQGDLVKAKTIYDPIQANYANNPWAQEVQGRLDRLKRDEKKATVKAPAPAAAVPAPAPPAAVVPAPVVHAPPAAVVPAPVVPAPPAAVVPAPVVPAPPAAVVPAPASPVAPAPAPKKPSDPK